MLKFYKKYLELIKSLDFAKYVHKFTEAVSNSIINNYNENESIIVKKIITEINNSKLKFSKNSILIETEGKFIHSYNISQYGSNPSGVKFNYYNEEANKELADIIFFIRFKYNNNIILEKVTFNQVKKDVSNNRWKIKKEQLYLLSRFPQFKGVEGSIIPQKEYYLIDYSNTLGTYSMLYAPSDLIFIGAPLLERHLNNAQSISLKNILKINVPIHHNNYFSVELFNNLSFIDFSNFWLKSCEYSHNIFNFVLNYLKGEIGEIINSKNYYNKGVNNLISEIISNASLIIKDKNIKSFLNKYFSSNNSSNIIDDNNNDDKNEFNGLGIIITTVLFEEEK